MLVESYCLGLILSVSCARPPAQGNPEKDIASKDYSVRLAAIDELGGGAYEKAEKWLLRALADDDWEVREHALEALGRVGTAKATLKPLLEAALEAPLARLRRAACVSLAQIGAADAAAALNKKLGGDTALRASQALVELGLAELSRQGAEARARPNAGKLERLLSSKDEAEREGAASALATLAALAEPARLSDLLARDDTLVRCAALEVVARAPNALFLNAVLRALQRPVLSDVEERRISSALEAICTRVLAREEALPIELAAQLAAFDGPRDRLARALELLQRTGLAARELGQGAVARRLVELCEEREPRVRCAALHALVSCAPDEAAAILMRKGASDESSEVRRLALFDLVRVLGLPEAEPDEAEPDGAAPVAAEPEEGSPAAARAARLGWLIDRLAGDASAQVREQAAVDLGRVGRPEVVEALTSALLDKDWRVAVCAAVSLGKTHAAAAVPVLVPLSRHADWRLRGAAAVALGELNQVGIMEPLIAALSDPEPAVVRSAHESLALASGHGEVEPTADAWKAWWKANRERHVFRDRRALAERQRRFGYSVPDSQVYEGLDVVVLDSRGDHIQTILERLKIDYRLTAGAQLPECGLHPGAIFVSNCTGEIEAGDVERLEWFVRVGGSLFGSCWALSQTIEAIYPGVIAKYETRSEVLGDVRAQAIGYTEEHPFLRGAFRPEVSPIYHLEGAHLIRVLSPERCQVLVDSAQAAARYGEGNLAAWFEAGHGLILDSVNHFELQGLESTIGLKTPEARQAYAIDHLGLDYARWREIQNESFWKSNHRASEEVWDGSAFRFVTNFVRAKRLQRD